MKKHSVLKAAALTAAAYTVSLRGRTKHPDLEILRRYRFAHRGYHDKPVVPENSLPAFRRVWSRTVKEIRVFRFRILLVIQHDRTLEIFT